MHKTQSSKLKTQNSETANRAAEKAAAEIVGTLPRMFKTVMRHGRDIPPHSALRTPHSELGDAQMWTLHALKRGRQPASELARRFNVTGPTMTRIVDALVEKAYVERQPDPDDRRRIYLQLTSAGEEVGDQVHERFQAALVRFLSPLSQSELEEIVRAFAHLKKLLPDWDEGCKS